MVPRSADERPRWLEHGRRAPSADLTFDALAAWYLDDYDVRRLRTLDTARGRVANLRAVFGGWPATAITTEAIRSYQRTRRTAGAAAATVNRETTGNIRISPTRFSAALRDEGVLVKETHEHTLRLAPPLVITKEDLELACDRLDRVLTATA